MVESKKDDLPLPELQDHLILEKSLYVWCLHKFLVVHSLAVVQSLHNLGA